MLCPQGLQPPPGGTSQPQGRGGVGGEGGGALIGLLGQIISPTFFPRRNPDIIDPFGNSFSFTGSSYSISVARFIAARRSGLRGSHSVTKGKTFFPGFFLSLLFLLISFSLSLLASPWTNCPSLLTVSPVASSSYFLTIFGG